ncbi:MAG TPA: hypothetical protein VHF89_10940 [Solirubrobacteraceae bacterium]|nr:hypothetical protein [Solirubrobacteraceae bacterium]
MSQVSLPMRIALGVTLVFAAVWLVALRPKPAPTPAPATPDAAQSAPGKAAEQATQAVGAQQQSAAEREQATTGAAGGGEAASGSATRPAQVAESGAGTGSVDVKALDKGPQAAKKVLTDVVRGKVAVLLFWDRRLTDDRAVHRAVTGLDRRGGKVAVHVAPIRNLAAYESITRGVPVVTSPTVLIIDRAGRARSVGGLTVPGELEELVGKALRVKP